MRVLLARLGWSSFNWRGLPDKPTQDEVKLYSNDVQNATMEYIRVNGHGHEWWNFDENFCKHFDLPNCDSDYYYGTVPRSSRGMRRELREALKGDEDLLVFFISRDPKAYQMKLVGIYCHARYMGDIYASVNNNYKNALVSNLVAKANISMHVKNMFNKNFTGITVIFKAPKKFSLVLPENAMVNINQRDLFGVFIGYYLDVEDVTDKANYDKLVDILNKIKEKLDSELAGKLGYIIDKLKEIKEEVQRELQKKITELVKKPPIEITIEYPSITNSEECAKALCEIAEILGFYCEKEYTKGTYRADVVWKKVDVGEPFIVFEIMHKGEAEKDVSSLEVMCEKVIPGATPVWVVNPARLDEAQRILEKRLLSEKIILMSFEDVAQILAYLRKLSDKLSEYNLEKLLKHG